MSNEGLRIEYFKNIDSFYAFLPKHLHDGIHQSPFQYKNWQCLLYKEFVLQHRMGRYLGAIMLRNEIPVVGGHFFTKKIGRKHGLFFLASASGETDYNDLIWFDETVQISDIDVLIRAILIKTGHTTFNVDRILKESLLAYWGESYATHKKSCICAEISIVGTYDEYWRSLSKNTRQNIRTAKNRLQKDGKIYSVAIYDGRQIPESTVRKLHDIYEQRRIAKNDSSSFKLRIYEVLRRQRKNKFDIIATAMQELENVYAAIISIDGEISGYFFGLKNHDNKASIMHVSYDNKYARYSPGMILISDTIEKIYEKGTLSTFDLTTGDEAYKLSLGTHEHTSECYIYSWKAN